MDKPVTTNEACVMHTWMYQLGEQYCRKCNVIKPGSDMEKHLKDLETLPTQMYWRDRDVETLTRDELILALRECYSMYRSLADSHASALNMWQLCNGVHRAR